MHRRIDATVTGYRRRLSVFAASILGSASSHAGPGEVESVPQQLAAQAGADPRRVDEQGLELAVGSAAA